MSSRTPGIGDNLDLHVKRPSLCENVSADVVVSKYAMVSSTINEGYLPKKFTFDLNFQGFVRNRLFFNTYLEVPYYSRYNANSPFVINGDLMSWKGYLYGHDVIQDPLHPDWRTIHYSGTLLLSSTFTSAQACHALVHMPVLPYKDHPSLPANDKISYLWFEIYEHSGSTYNICAAKAWYLREGGWYGAALGGAEYKANQEFRQLFTCHFSASANATYTVKFWCANDKPSDTSTVGTVCVGACAVDKFLPRFGMTNNPLYYSHVDYLSENCEIFYNSGVHSNIHDIPHPPISLDGQVFLKNTVNQYSFTISKDDIILRENETQILDSTYVDGISLASRSVTYSEGRVTGTAWIGLGVDQGMYQFTINHSASIPGWQHLWATRERIFVSGVYYYEGDEPEYSGKTYYNDPVSAITNDGYYYIYVNKPRRYVTDRDNWSASMVADGAGHVWWRHYKWMPLEQDGYTDITDLMPQFGTGTWQESLRRIKKREFDVDYLFYTNDDWGIAPPYLPDTDIFSTHIVKTGTIVQCLITKPQKLWIKVRLKADLARLRIGYDNLLYDNRDVIYANGIPTYIHSYDRGSSSIISQIEELIADIPSLADSSTASIIEQYQIESDRLVFPNDIGIYNITFRHTPLSHIRRGEMSAVPIQMSRDFDSGGYWHLPAPLITSTAYHNYVQLDLSGSYPMFFWIPPLPWNAGSGVVGQFKYTMDSSTGHIAYVNWMTSATAGTYRPFMSHISNFYAHWIKYTESILSGAGHLIITRSNGGAQGYVTDAWSGSDGDPNANNYGISNGYVFLPTYPDWLLQIRSNYSTYWTSSVITYGGLCHSGIVPPMSFSGGVYTATVWTMLEIASKLYEDIPVSTTVTIPLDEISGWGQYTQQYIAEIDGEIDYIPVTGTPINISSTCGIAKVIIDA